MNRKELRRRRHWWWEVWLGQDHQGVREGAVPARTVRQFKFLLQHNPKTAEPVNSQLQYSQLLTLEAMISPTTSPWVGSASVGTWFSILDWSKNKRTLCKSTSFSTVHKMTSILYLCPFHSPLLHGRNMVVQCKAFLYFLSLSSLGWL